MKKTAIILILVLVAIVIFLSNFGFEIGNVRIGKQVDLKTKQLENFEESYFYSKYYTDSDLTILNIWATWCKPCIAEMPELNEIKEKFKNSAVNFVSLSIDNDSIKLVHFLESDQFSFTDITMEDLEYRNAILNKLEGRDTDKHIFVHTVPLTYIIKNKKILKKIEGTIEPQGLIDLIEKNLN